MLRFVFLLGVLVNIWIFAELAESRLDNFTETDSLFLARERRALPSTNRPGRIDPQCRVCGVSASATLARVINGVPVKPRWKYPWVVPMAKTGSSRFFCGGALLNKEFVLTAAHCIRNPLYKTQRICMNRGQRVDCFLRPDEISVAIMGESHTRPIGLVRTSIIHVHPQYDYWLSLNDIAIMRLSRPIPQCSKYISPICLPTRPLSKMNQQVVVAGWGRSKQRRVYEGPQMFREGRVTEVDPTFCQRSNNRERRRERIYCTRGVPSYNQSSCEGDSGSSVFANFGAFYTLGVTSMHSDSERCPIDGVVSFASTYGYRDFILPIVGALPQPPTNRRSYY